MSVMCIQMEEGEHAFRVNGVTFAKKHLRALFPSWGDSRESFCRYLVIAPFLSERKDVDEAPTKVGKYAILKAQRIQKALEVYGELIAPFMMALAQMGELPMERLPEIMDQLHDHVCDCGAKISPSPVVDLRRLH